jgi:hypothetical protein
MVDIEMHKKYGHDIMSFYAVPKLPKQFGSHALVLPNQEIP